mgnify:FL=1
MANENYVSAINTDALVLPVKSATIYAAQEQSLFLGGALIPVVNAPNGVAHFPELGTVDADKISSATNADIETELPTSTKNATTCNLYAARSVVRDLGAIDPTEIGRVLGQAVAKKFDLDVMTALGGLTGQEIASGDLDLDEIFSAVGTIRAAGEMGQLFGIVGADSYAALMSNVGSTAYAGGDFQTEGLRNGFMANIAGIQCFVSAHHNATNVGVTGAKMSIFGQDAFRIAMQKNVDLEVQRRAAAVGVDVVSSLHAAVATIDASRGVLIKDAS